MKSGSYDFERDLEDLGKKLGTKAIREAQKQALKPLAAEIKEVAPVDSGELKTGIKTKTGPRKKGYITTVVEIKTPADNPHASRSEFGTRDMPAKPFIRPTAKRMTPDVVDTMLNVLDAAIGKALAKKLT